MNKKEQKRERSLLFDKITFTILIMCLYVFARMVPLGGVDLSAVRAGSPGGQSVLLYAVSGDMTQTSILALGIAPSMLAGIIVQVAALCRKRGPKSNMTDTAKTMLTMLVTFLIAAVQAYIRIGRLEFAVPQEMLLWTKIIAFVQLVTGAFIIVWIGSRNKLYGIGGQSAIIVVNIISTLISQAAGMDWEVICQCFFVFLPVILIMLVMENTEKRLPMQRIAIHNIYGDKNYLAVKMNPVGAMPIMFASVVFFLPQLLTRIVAALFPDRPLLLYLADNMELTKALGTIVYLILLFLLTVVFAFIFINPSDLSEQLQKSGDSIVGLHPGSETKKYLFKNILCISFVSASVICLCMAVPMVLRLHGVIDDSVAMLPTSFMIISGLGSSIANEAEAVHNLDSYTSFL